jgi:uncharacterized membrane protein
VTASERAAARRSQAFSAERIAGRLLIVVTYVSVGLLAIGLALMLIDGISPLDGGPPLDLATLGAQLLAFEPAAFLWVGLLAVIAAPIGRVIVSGISYGRAGDRLMVAVSIGILAVIAVGVGTALTVTV